jgi:ABC-2 type transport system permease protein
MARILTMAVKDLRLLMRDRFGLFWVLAFPFLMALFFGSMFSGVGGGGRSGSMKVALITDNRSQAAADFYKELEDIDVISASYMSADSAQQLVAQGKLVAYVHYHDTVATAMSMFGGGDSQPIEVGIDPARKAEQGYLQGLISQAYFSQMQTQMMDPSIMNMSIDQQLAAIDTASGLSGEQAGLLKGFLTDLQGFMNTVDAGDSAGQAAVEENTPFGGVEIEFSDVAMERIGPRSSWEITFPQALQWALIGVCAAFAIGMVVERTRGTYLRLRLAPIGRAQILAGKGVACFLAAIFVCSLLLGTGILIFGVQIGSYAHLAMALLSSGICFVGLMMLISVLGKTEQSVGGAGWALLMVLSMTGGGMMPLFFMPGWMATIGSISAVKWSILAFEGAIWRGLSTQEMLKPIGILLGYGTAAFLAGLLVMRRTEE